MNWSRHCVGDLWLRIELDARDPPGAGLNALSRLDVVWLAGCLELIIGGLRRCISASKPVGARQPGAVAARLHWQCARQLVWVLFASTLVIAGLVLITGIFVDVARREATADLHDRPLSAGRGWQGGELSR